MTNQREVFLRRAAVISAILVFAAGCSKQVESVPVATPTVPANSMPPSPPVAATPASTTVGTAIDDTVVTAGVKSALLADADIKSFDFKVETRKGVVMLSGFVDNQLQLDRATSLAKSISGVDSVQNNVTLKTGSATSVGTKVDDSIVTGKVKAALIADEAIKSTDIAVVTRQGEVQLSGFVNNQTQIDRALLIANAVEGVSKVSNEMTIKK